jgi:FkbM family methyltransferase
MTSRLSGLLQTSSVRANRGVRLCLAVGMSAAISACTRPASPRPDASQVPPPALTCPVRGDFEPASGYYSQFYEDYILAYVFRDEQNGVYVDVGANDPDSATVTKYFYRAGWRGINIEPIPELIQKLKEQRPEDINLGIGISDVVSELTFYRAQYSGLSTFDPLVMKRHKDSGISFDELRIPVFTLTAVFDAQPIVRQGIAFLNADVEGYEKQVFSGIDFTRYRPRVVMAESTAPLTETPTHQAWESILTGAGYLFAMDDGLNRYYVHSSQLDLLPRFLEANYCVGRDKLSKGIKLDGFKPVGTP